MKEIVNIAILDNGFFVDDRTTACKLMHEVVNYTEFMFELTRLEIDMKKVVYPIERN